MSPGMMVKTKATSITESELKMNLFCISNKRKSCWNAGTKPTRLHAYEQSISEIKPVDNKSFLCIFFLLLIDEFEKRVNFYSSFFSKVYAMNEEKIPVIDSQGFSSR